MQNGFDDKSVSRDIVAVLDRLARIETRLDVVIERHSERLDTTEKDLREIVKRVDQLERQLNMTLGKLSVVAVIAGSLTSAFVAFLVKSLTSS